MCTAALITIVKTWKQLMQPSMDEQRKSGVCIYIYIYMHVYIYVCIILAIKNEILPFVTTQMDLEGISLSKIS